MNKLLRTGLALFCLLLATSVHAGPRMSADYTIVTDTMDTGGVNAQSASYSLRGSAAGEFGTGSLPVSTSAAYTNKLDQQLYTDPIMEKFAALTQETVFGTLWTRPGLDLKTRTMICVVSDTATGRTPELKLHIRFARNHGWAEDELVEAFLHLLGYVGAPLVREALLVAKETFAEMRAENPVTS